MRIQSALASAVSLASLVAAQTYAEGLVQALNEAGLTALAGALGAAPQELVSALEQGNHTVFAPNNEALSDLPANLDIAKVLSYHVLSGLAYEDELTDGNNTVYRTLLTGSPDVLLPSNQSQVLVLTKDGDDIQVINGGEDIDVSSNSTYRNLQILAIDEILRIPGNISTVVGNTDDLSALAGAAPPGVIDAVEAIRGVTVFAPVNRAFGAAAEALASANETTIQTVLGNHIIDGTVLYSGAISDGSSAISGSGQQFSFASNSSGVFVTSGSSTARVIRADVIVRNGVVHLIDGVLLNTNSDPAAAESAASSASAAQETSSPAETNPVTSAAGGGATPRASLNFPVVPALAVLVSIAAGAALV